MELLCNNFADVFLKAASIISVQGWDTNNQTMFDRQKLGDEDDRLTAILWSLELEVAEQELSLIELRRRPNVDAREIQLLRANVDEMKVFNSKSRLTLTRLRFQKPQRVNQ